MKDPEDSTLGEKLFIQRWGDSAWSALQLIEIQGLGATMRQCYDTLEALKEGKGVIQTVSSEELRQIVRLLLPSTVLSSPDEAFDPGLLLAQIIEAELHLRRWGELDHVERRIMEAWADGTDTEIEPGQSLVIREDYASLPLVHNFLFWWVEHAGHVPWYLHDGVRQ